MNKGVRFAFRNFFPIIGIVVFGCLAPALAESERDEAGGLWARVNVAAALSEQPFPVYAHLRDASGQDYVLTRAAPDALTRAGYSFEIIAEADAATPLYLARSRRAVMPRDIPASIRILYDDGYNLLLLPGTAAERAALSRLGYQLRRLPDTPMSLPAPKTPARREEAATLSSNAFVAGMIARVQMTNLNAMISELTGATPVMAGGVYTNIATRNTYETNALNRALDYAQSRLRALGLDVQYQEWATNDYWGVRAVAGRNIIAERTGSTTPSEIIVICGHIDSEPEGPLAPGADDNASGAGGVLAAARAMQKYTFERTIRYVLFTGEEQGILGSEAYATAIQATGDNVVGVYNLDMLAYDGNADGKLNLHTRMTNAPGYEDDFAIASIFTNVAGLYPLEGALEPRIFADGQQYSDHAAFWAHGYPALLAIEDWYGDVTPYYHTTNDLIGTLNFPYYTAFVQATVAAAAHSASPLGELSPAANVSNAVHAARAELETALGKPVPSLSICLQTSNALFFASSASAPEKRIATNTTFRFASNTKNFTATAVLLLQQMELLKITNRIVDFMPGTDQPFIPAGANWAIPNKNVITIEQLLRHSAGVYDVDNDPVPGCGGTSYTDYMTTLDPAHQFTVEEMVGQAALHQLVYFAPDEGYHYSNTGYAMLAEIVGRVYSHYMGETKTLSDFLYDHIVGPDIRFPNLATDTALPEPFSPGTERRPSNITVLVSNANMSAQVGEGNGYGPLPALNRHIRSTLKGEGALSNDFVRLMQTDTSPHNANYALGCVWTPDIGFGHNGCRVGNLSFMAYNPDTDVSVAVYLAVVDYSDLMNSFMICYQGMYNTAYRALEALGYPRMPILSDGSHTNLILAAGETNTFYFNAAKDVYYGIRASNQVADLLLALAPAVNPEAQTLFTNGLGWTCPAPGTYRVQVSSAENTPATLRLYTLTNTISQTTALITNLMAQHQVPALSIALVDGNNIVWAQGFGMANRATGIAAGPDTIYRIASCSKTFAAASILQLQDTGLLNIEDAVTHSVPAFSMLPRYPDQSSITIRELLAHQAQLPGSYFRHADSTIPYDGYYDQALALLAEDYPVEPRGFLQKYNNNGFTLIEGVVASANTNGLSYSEFAASKLFQPMGMSNTTFRLADHQTNLLAKVYRNGALAPDEFVNTPGSGGAYSTAADLARYARFLLGYGTFNGTRILSSNAVAALWSDQSAQVALVNKEDYAKSGLGWDQIADPSFAYAGRMAWKDGDSLNYSAIICVMPEQGLAAVALNSIPGADNAAAPAAKLALKLALQERDGLPLPSTNSPAFPVSPVTTLTEQELDDIVGTYSAAGGYDLVTGTVSAITWITGAGGASPVRHEGLVPHEDGWFSTTNAPEFRLSFTNIGGRVIMRNQVRYEEYLRIIIQAERFTPAPLSAAWSNRVGKTWITADLEPESYLWLLGFYPTLQLGIADGVLSVYSSPCETLQPQGDDLAFPFSMNADQPSALQVKHTNGHEVIRYSGYDFLCVDDLPALQVGQSATGTLAAGASLPFQFTVADPVWHGLYVSPTNLVLRQETSDLSEPGTYSLILQNPGTSAAPYTLRLYTLTNTIARVSSLITNLMAGHNLVGCGISLVDGNQTVWKTGFGHADKERGIVADENTVFMIGSCSKTFGAVAAMQLAEEGLLDLDASITNALPDFSIHQRFAGDVITPRTILTHHSGLPGDVFNQGFTVRPLPGVPDAVQAMLAGEYTLMPTNTMWAYNNSGLVLLGQMFRHITGQSLDVFARERLFDRMGMTNSSIVFDLPCIREHLARPYVGGTVQPDEYVNLFFAGAIYSTASDMARYMRMLLAGGQGDSARVVSNETLHAMTVKQNSDIPLDQYVSMLNQGIGFLLDPLSLQYMGKVIWHDGGTVYFRTLMRVAVDAQLGCFISCNSYEGAALNYSVVDAALQWAYEEKTGGAPPAPLDPGTPSTAVPPPDVLALATNGAFVTGDGYDCFRYDGTHLFARFNAQSDESTEGVWTYRENGWFTPTNAYVPQLVFTQVAGRVISVLKTYAAITNLTLLGERSADIAGFHPAWSNRLGRWWAINLHPDDIAWHGDDLRLAWPMLRLYERDNMLFVQAENLYVMSATNDALAFAAGLGRNKGSSLRAPSAETLAFMGVTYRNEADIPVLSPGSSTNGITAGDETHWFRIPATASPLTFDLATDHDITAYLCTTNDSYLGQANRAHAFHLDATHGQPVMAAVVRNGTNVGPWRLTIHTNTIPFQAFVPASQWPATLAEKSNLYPHTDFSYVFVHENRTNPSGNLLKIAVARMNSSQPSAPPIVYCAGGPGTPGILCAYQYFMKAFTNEYNVYLVDQRGIGYTQPWLASRDDEAPSDMQYRIIMLEQGDLSAVNTLESSRDFDDIAAVFNLTNANLYGISYGTLLSQTIMRREPSWLRAVVLEGVMAPNIPPLSQTGPIRDDALNALFEDVAEHPRASAWYPDFSSNLYLLGTRLQDHPVPVPHAGVTNQMDGLAYLNQVLNQMTVSDLGCRERIPAIVWRALRGDVASLAELYADKTDTNRFAPNVRSELMQVMVLKHDVLPFDTLEAASNACANLPPLSRELNIKFMQDFEDIAALFDPLGEAEPCFTEPVTSAIPTLVMNGLYDTQTGTNWAAEVARHLPRAHFVAVPAVGHGVLKGGECPMQIIRGFLAQPTNAPDTSCLTGMSLDFPPPWPTNAPWLDEDASVTQVVDDAHAAVWHRFSAASGSVYSMMMDAVPGSYILYAVGTNAQILASATNEAMDWLQPGDDVAYLWLIPQASGLYSMSVTYPLLLRALSGAGNEMTISWQSQTNGTYELWQITNLLDAATCEPVATNLDATGRFTIANYTAGVARAVLFLRKNN